MMNIEMAEGTLGRVVTFRLKPGTDVLLGLTELCRQKGIRNGVIVSAIGSLDNVQFCDPIVIPESKAGYGYGRTLHLAGPIELLSASGLICHDGDALSLHIHIDLSDANGNAYGGHLVEGTTVLLTLDGVIAEINGIDMGRQYSEELEVPVFHPVQKSAD